LNSDLPPEIPALNTGPDFVRKLKEWKELKT